MQVGPAIAASRTPSVNLRGGETCTSITDKDGVYLPATVSGGSVVVAQELEL